MAHHRRHIERDPAQNRFVTSVNGDEAYVDYEQKSDDTLDYTSTFVPEEHREEGVGHELVIGALDYARENNMRVIATCPFVKQVIEDNPEYEDVTKSS